MIFPQSLRVLAYATFARCAHLNTVILNEGLEVLGTEEVDQKYSAYNGVFSKSALENISLPSTLKRIEHDAFYGCKNLRDLKLPERLEYIGIGCFYASGLESI